MRKFIILLAALAIAGAVQTVPRTLAQTAAASNDAGATTTLSAQQEKQKKKTAAPARAAPARSVSRPAARSVSRPAARSVSRPATRSVSRPTSPARNVARPTTPTRKVVRPTSPTRNVVRPTTPTRNIAQPNKPTRNVMQPATSPGRTKSGLTAGSGRTKTGLTAGTGRTKTGLTAGPGRTKTGLTAGPGRTKTGLTAGPGRTKTGVIRGPGRTTRVGVGTVRNNGLRISRDGGRRIVINRDRRRIFVNNGWRTLVPLVALGAFVYGAETYYADGYISMAEPECSGFADDGSRLRWMAVPTEDGGSEYQCVAYSTQRNRTVTEIEVSSDTPLADVPPAEAPPAMISPETTGVATPEEPAAVAAVPPAPATGCELLIYSEANFKGMSSPVGENQASLDEEGWKNEIASIEIKSGTWDFYSDEDFGGEMMRLSVGTYPTLDPKWSKHIGSFMCSAPAK